MILNHGDGYYTLYAHVSATYVTLGQDVKHGAVIAEVGDTGSLDGFECHFEIRKAKSAVNPLLCSPPNAPVPDLARRWLVVYTARMRREKRATSTSTTGNRPRAAAGNGVFFRRSSATRCRRCCSSVRGSGRTSPR